MQSEAAYLRDAFEVAELLGKSDMAFVVQARVAEDEDGVLVGDVNELLEQKSGQELGRAEEGN